MFELRDSLKRYLVRLYPRVDQPSGFLQKYYAQVLKEAVEKYPDEFQPVSSNETLGKECKRRKAIIRLSETRTNLRYHQGLVQEKLRTPVHRDESHCSGSKSRRREEQKM